MPVTAATLKTLAAAALIALALAACGGDDDGETPSPTATVPTSPENCAPNQAVSLEELAWLEIFPHQVVEKDEWRILRAQGEGPFISASRDMEIVGSIELLQFPLEADFLPADGIAALEAWASDYYAGVESDRAASYGQTYAFTSETPTAVNVGTFCAISYGYTGTNAGEDVDRLRGYATFDRGNLYLIVGQYDAGLAGEQGFVDAEAMADFEPYFADFIQTLVVPPGSEAPATESPAETEPAPSETPEGQTPLG
jgi:hypothetical protein